MNQTMVTILKDFELYGHKYFKGNWIEMTPGSNIPQDIFNQLLETGAIEIGKNDEFIKEQGRLNALKNKGEHHGSD